MSNDDPNVRRTLHLRFKQLRDALILRIRRLRLVETLDQLPPFMPGQNGQAQRRRLRCSLQSLHQ